MTLTSNRVFVSALLCGTIGFAGLALAAPAGSKSIGDAGGKASAAATASESTTTTDAGAKPSFLNSVQSASTPAKGLNKAATAKVDEKEKLITAELNRASASSTGNAAASNQASISDGGANTTQ